MIITFEGHSDDIVTWGVGKSLVKLHTDEHYVEDCGTVSYAAFRIATPGGTKALVVHAVYANTGTWAFAYGQPVEGSRMPTGWAFTVSQAHEYSTRLLIDTADDLVEVEPIHPKVRE